MRYKRTIAILTLWVATAGSAVAQQPYLDMAPLRFSAQALVAPNPDAWTIGVAVDRSVPLHFFLPNVGSDSRMDVASVALGIRSTPQTDAFRFRIMALDMHVSKPPWNGGMTLLRYDRMGMRTLEADWLALHAGPAARLPLGAAYVQPFVTGQASLASRTTGRHFFPELSNRADDRAFGLAASASAGLLIAQPGVFALDATVTAERHFSNPEPELRRFRASLLVVLHTRWEVLISGGSREDTVADRSATTTFAGFGIRYTPEAQAY